MPNCHHQIAYTHLSIGLAGLTVRAEEPTIPPMSKQVMIVDDQQMFIQGLSALIRERVDLTVAHTANSGAEAIEKALKYKPDLILMDVFMVGINGIEAVGMIRKSLDKCRIIALSSFAEREPVLRMLSAGANGYVLKANAFTELTYAIDTVLRGLTFLSPEVAGLVVQGALDQTESLSQRSLLDILTQRERMVMQLLGVSGMPGLYRLAAQEGLVQ